MKTKIKTNVSKDISCADYIGKPAINELGETIGVIIDAVEFDTYIQLTMEVELPFPPPRSFEFRGKK